MDGVYLLQPNGDITSLLGGYSKNFEEEAFKEFGDKTQNFGQLFKTDFVEVCHRRVFSFDIAERTRISFVLNKNTPPIDGSPNPTTLFRVAFETFKSKIIPNINSEADLTDYSSRMLLECEGGETIPSIDLLRSSELLLQLALDWEKFVVTQSKKDFPSEDWQSVVGIFKDDVRMIAVRASSILASQLNIVQNQLALMQQDCETSRLLRDERDKQIDHLNKAVQTLSLHLVKSEQIQTSSLTQRTPEFAGSPNITIINSQMRPDESKMLSTTGENRSISKHEGEEKELLEDHDVANDSNPLNKIEGNVKVANELEKLLLASKQAVFYLQRDLQAMKLERDSYYQQILELRRARQIYESRRSLENIPPAEPPVGFQKKKELKEEDVSATVNGKANTLIGEAGPRKGTN